MIGTVIKSTGSWYNVQTDCGLRLDCRIKGKFRQAGLTLTNPVAVGDRVQLVPEAGQPTAMITEILPRRNYLIRESTRRKHQLHLMACNIDQAILVTTIREPNLKFGFIDRFLLNTAPQDIPTLIVFNKTDIYDSSDWETLNAARNIYEKIGYSVLAVSVNSGAGLQELKAALMGKISFVSGFSGVGKSSLINKLDPTLNLRATPLSEATGKGQHTTTFAEWHALSGDPSAAIIDTPGIKELGFLNLNPLDVAHNYKEFLSASEQCRFGTKCMHLNEPDCAVKNAVESGEISPLRYQSYQAIQEEVGQQNSWERKTDW